MHVRDLINVDELAALLAAPETCVFDASWYLPAHARDPEAEFLTGHIPGARRFDFDGVIARHDTDLPHMLPPPDELEQHLRRLGVNNDSTVVVYDGMGVFASPRAWWMLRAAGLARVAVLDGGLPAWVASGRALEAGPEHPAPPGDVTVQPPGRWLANMHDVQSALVDGQCAVLDARPAPRFAGAAPEPRAGLRSGHMPGALSLPADSLVKDGCLLSAASLDDAFDALAPSDRRLVFSCGSGVTAAILALAARVCGRTDVAVYDGSWAEWGLPDGPAVATGAPDASAR